MKKIPTIFVRDWEGTIGPPGRGILDEPHPDCGWVFAGEGVATRKLDGTCCLIRDGKLYRRHEVKLDRRTGKLRSTPESFEAIETDEETGAMIGWVPVGDGPEDQWYRAAFERPYAGEGWKPNWTLSDGTYELVGPHVNGNPEHVGFDFLWAHDDADELSEVPLTYEGLQAWFGSMYLWSDYQHGIEGIVWHHPDGRMAKIKARDFGIERTS